MQRLENSDLPSFDRRDGVTTYERPLVSIVISTFNRSNSIIKALESVLSQRYDKLQILIIDDASKDDTLRVLEEFTDYPNVTIITNDSNLGLAKSLNKGLSIAEGDYIARLDDDDVWIDNAKLAMQIEFLEKNPQYAVVGTAYIDENGRKIINPKTDREIRKQMLFRCPFCHSTVLIRRKALRELGGYDDSLPYAEDWELWLRLGQKYSLANLEEVTVKKNDCLETMSNRHFFSKFSQTRKMLSPYWKHYSYGFTARLYHLLVESIFKTFPRHGRIHRIANMFFMKAFLR